MIVYPSTEWHMSQPFDCACGNTQHCLGKIDGAHSIPPATLKKYFINDHIKAIKRDQIQQNSNLGEEDKKEQLQLLQ